MKSRSGISLHVRLSGRQSLHDPAYPILAASIRMPDLTVGVRRQKRGMPCADKVSHAAVLPDEGQVGVDARPTIPVAALERPRTVQRRP
jgi:hypothetical protein